MLENNLKHHQIMSRLHEPEIGKTRRIAGYVLTIIPSLMIIGSGLAKVSGAEQMIENMGNIGLGEMTLFIGVLEILCVILYWIPKTSNIGFFLLCSYAGGIIVGELIGGNLPIPGISISVLFYVGTTLRKPYLSGLGI